MSAQFQNGNEGKGRPVHLAERLGQALWLFLTGR
jgi:hypothetical protein